MDFELRNFQSSDSEALSKHANNLKIAQFMTDAFPHPYGIQDAKAFINSVEKNDKIQAIVTDEIIGAIGFFPQEGIMRTNAELGYWLSEDFWGKGIMTQAINRTVSRIFTHYDILRIYARPFGTNIASQRVLEKCGFSLEGKFEKTIIKNEQFHDEIVYAIRKETND